ncbi:hypothetical protein F4777DRAFT_581599 [Nemania sp. FL0916]|nr:hypothetical protein F4777DRAFT_581599 [Nemania sp. FL0916]
MAEWQSAKLPEEEVKDAMWADLGNHREEEHAVDDDRGSSRRPNTLANTSSVLVATTAQHARSHGGDKETGGRFADWRRATDERWFENDDDAAAVRGLDPLDNGNAHRLGRPALQNLPVGNHNYHSTGNARRNPSYNPSQPTYSKSKLARQNSNENRRPNAGHSSGPSNMNPRMSSFGGVVPDGGEVKKWGPGKPTDATHRTANMSMNSFQDQSRPMPSKKHSPELPAPSSGPDHGQRKLPPHLRGLGISQNNGELATSSGPSIRKAEPTAKSPTEQHLLPSQPSHPILASNSMPGASLEKPQDIDSQEASIRDAGNIIRNTTTPEAHRTLFQMDVCVSSEEAKFIVYELADAPIAIWELIEREKVRRGDIRDLVAPLLDASRVRFRWNNKQGKMEKPVLLHFPGIPKAKEFFDQVKKLWEKFLTCSDPNRAESTVKIQPGNTECTVPTTTPEPTKNTPYQTPAVPTKLSSPELGLQSLQPKDRKLDNHKGEATSAKLEPLGSQPLQSKGADLFNPKAKEFKPSETDTGFGESKIDSGPSTSHGELIAAQVAQTTAGPKAQSGGGLKGSRWAPPGDDDLLSFSPELPTKYLPTNNQIGSCPQSLLDREDLSQDEISQGGVGEHGVGAVSEHGVSGQPVEPVDQLIDLTESDQTPEEAIMALRGFNIHDLAFGDSSEPIHLPCWGSIEDCKILAQKSKLLTIALNGSSTPTFNAPFLTALLYLAEKQEFLHLQPPEQEECLVEVYNMIGRCSFRIVRTGQEMYGWRADCSKMLSPKTMEVIGEVNKLNEANKAKQKRGHYDIDD